MFLISPDWFDPISHLSLPPATGSGYMAGQPASITPGHQTALSISPAPCRGNLSAAAVGSHPARFLTSNAGSVGII